MGVCSYSHCPLYISVDTLVMHQPNSATQTPSLILNILHNIDFIPLLELLHCSSIWHTHPSGSPRVPSAPQCLPQFPLLEHSASTAPLLWLSKFHSNKLSCNRSPLVILLCHVCNFFHILCHQEQAQPLVKRRFLGLVILTAFPIPTNHSHDS